MYTRTYIYIYIDTYVYTYLQENSAVGFGPAGAGNADRDTAAGGEECRFHRQQSSPVALLMFG